VIDIACALLLCDRQSIAYSTTLPFPLVLRNQGTVTVEEGYFSAILDGYIHKCALIDTAVASFTPRRCLEYHRMSHMTVRIARIQQVFCSPLPPTLNSIWYSVGETCILLKWYANKQHVTHFKT
jgi:hypothetical protein